MTDRKRYRDGQKFGPTEPTSLEDFRLNAMKGEQMVVARGIEHLERGGRWSDSGLKSWLKSRGYALQEETDVAVLYRGTVINDQGQEVIGDELVRLFRLFMDSPDPGLGLEDEEVPPAPTFDHSAVDPETGAYPLPTNAQNAQAMEAFATWQWLASTYLLQSQTYGFDFDALARAPDTLADYLDWNTTAAVQELAELREEFSWKPWATDEPFVNRDRIRDEAIDVLHFIGNILVGIGVTDEELETAYQAKQAKNRARQASGTYSARKGGLAEGSEA